MDAIRRVKLFPTLLSPSLHKNLTVTWLSIHLILYHCALHFVSNDTKYCAPNIPHCLYAEPPPLLDSSMASISQGHPAFPARSTYAASGKLPDRTGLNNPPPFGSSALSRRPDQQSQQYAHGPVGPQQQIQGGGGRGHQHQQQQQSGADKEPNPLNELSEEQREEINEAVCLESNTKQQRNAVFSPTQLQPLRLSRKAAPHPTP